jgi:hypothetical protein
MAKTAKDWHTAVEGRYKALKNDWLDEAEKVVDIYEGAANTPFNILYSNTETLLPTLYNSTPRPEVERRHTAPASMRKIDTALSIAAERFLEYVADSNDSEYDTFDESVSSAVVDALVPGAGEVRVRLKQKETHQAICFEHVLYNRFVWGYAKTWKQVPWVAYGHDLSRHDFEQLFPKFAKSAKYKDVNWDALEAAALESQTNFKSDEAGEKRREPTLLVWEIWEPGSRKIYWICDQWPEDLVQTDDYPFELTSRVPSPAPLRFVRRVANLTPVPPYELYKEQAEELNRITRRLNKVINAIRVRGVYDGRLGEIETLLSENFDNQLIAVEQAAALENGGFDKAIWFLPVENLIAVALSLQAARDATKATIFEIMGLGDILRGASNPNETAKAQEIKNQWGGLRVKRMQKDVQNFCRALFRIAFEFGSHTLTPMSWKSITQLPYLFQGQKQQLQQAAMQDQQMQEQFQMMAQQAQMQGMEPPEPPQPSIGEEEQFLMGLPVWEEIVEIFQNRFERTYRIDVETNSTVDLEATEDKVQIAEFMNAWGQMMSGLQPMIMEKVLPFEAGKMIMLEVFRRYRFGRRVEMALEMMQEPAPPPDQKALEEKQKAEIMKIQSEAARKVGEMQETIIEITGKNTELQIQNTALKEGVSLEKKVAQSDLKTRENELKNDFANKVRAKEDQLHEQKAKLQMESLQVQLEKIIAKHEIQMDKLAARVEELGAAEVPASGGGSGDSDSKGKEPPARVDGLSVQKRHDEMMQAMVESQKSFQNMVTQLALALAAPRRTELIRDPKTGKAVASVSEIVDPKSLN